MNKLELAKYYYNLGWALTPIIVGQKRPPELWKKFQTQKATLEQVLDWVKKDEDLGLITGALSGIVVLDDDREKLGLEPFGVDSAIVCVTKNGGKHYYFKYDGEGNKVHKDIHVDIRGEGGLVVLPFGNGYKWLKAPTKENLKELKPLGNIKERLPVSSSERIDINASVGVEIGNRNESLHKFACSILNKYPQSDWNSAYQIIRGTNLTFKPPLSEDEVKTIIESAGQFVFTHPKTFNEQPLVTNVVMPRTLGELAPLAKEMRELENEAPSTGYLDLDKIIKGFIPTHLYTLTGETNVGKSSLACNFAFNLAVGGKKVLYLALEPDINITTFFAALSSGKTFDEVEQSDYVDIPGIDILLQSDCPSMEILKKVMKQSFRNYNLIIIDHLGYFSKNSPNFFQQQADLVRELAIFTKENKTAVLVVAHPNKGSSDRKLTMSDIAGSASFKQDSTEVLILHRGKLSDDPFDDTLSRVGTLSVPKKKVSSISPKSYIKLFFRENNPKITSEYSGITVKPEANLKISEKHGGLFSTDTPSQDNLECLILNGSTPPLEVEGDLDSESMSFLEKEFK